MHLEKYVLCIVSWSLFLHRIRYVFHSSSHLVCAVCWTCRVHGQWKEANGKRIRYNGRGGYEVGKIESFRQNGLASKIPRKPTECESKRIRSIIKNVGNKQQQQFAVNWSWGIIEIPQPTPPYPVKDRNDMVELVDNFHSTYSSSCGQRKGEKQGRGELKGSSCMTMTKKKSPQRTKRLRVPRWR